MIFWKTLIPIVAGVIAVIAVAVLAGRARASQPVRFKTFEEVGSVTDVVVWASKQIPADDQRRSALRMLFIKISPPSSAGLTPPSLVGMSVEDLALAAPFIDECIAGRGPPLNMPAEYEDWRPAALAAFKARIQAEGLWPREAVAPDAATNA
jgi:hypothetical protein